MEGNGMCRSHRCECYRHPAAAFTDIDLRIAIAVGRDVFRPDSAEFVELLMRIQSMPISKVALSHL